MKELLILVSIFFTIIFNNTKAQVPNWLWVNGVGGNYNDIGNSICTDANGNSIVVGNYTSDTIIFGTNIFTDTNVSAVEPYIFIVKYGISGNVLWAKSAGGPYRTYASCVCTDPQGNIIVTGYFLSSTITFGSITLNNNTGSDDIFVVKYDSNGNVLWATSAGGIDNDRGYGVCADASGNILVTGWYFKEITFGSFTLTNADSLNPSIDIFLVKFDSTGNVLWATCSGGTNNCNGVGYSVAADPYGNIFVIGDFFGPSITFGTMTLYNTDNTFSTTDVFIAKFDSSGHPLWVKSASGNFMDYGNSISTDLNGNVYAIGSFESYNIMFGNIFLINSDVLSYSNDVFIVKFDSSGNPLWITNPTGGGDSGNGIFIDANGNSIVTGEISDDLFVAKYDSAGNELWIKNAVGGNNSGNSVCADTSGNIFLTGYFEYPTCILDGITLSSAGNQDLFIGKLDHSFSTGLINENDISNLVSIFPNPNQNSFIIKLNSKMINAKLEIFNILGEKIYSMLLNNRQIINHNFPVGIYFLKVTDGEKHEVEKLIIR